ncbi:hypothetical protein WAK64_17970 [Bacillus spongiae]|uniref:Uncharacterized protein n=1 Tax=Bacillus spongiae TaxID=2683610 RepID=A0ABU8HIH4_9BACI
MKEIKSITPTGITYINELGAEKFVDFNLCNQNWIAYRIRTEKLDGK